MIPNNCTISSSTYLLNCDVVSKYHLKSNFDQPKITEINFRVFIDEVISASFFSTSNDKDNHLKIKSMILVYMILSFFPKIIAKKKKTGKKKNSFLLDDEEYVYEMKITKKNDINHFLSRLFFETKFVNENLNKKELKNISIQSKNRINLNTRVPATQFFDINEFFNLDSNDWNLNKVFIHTNFIYSNIPKNTQVLNVIKNNFFFV
jgi:hypothetical protein